jgi:hypothetical protein
MRKWSMRILRLVYTGLILCLPVAAIANYTATQGAGTTFGSVVIGGVHFFSNLVCDVTTANQCATVDASGNVHVSATGLAIGSTTAGETGSLSMGATTTAPPSYTTAQTNPVSLDRAGNTRVALGAATPVTPLVVLATDNHQVLANGAGTALSVHTSNNSATKNYLRLYDAGTGFNGCNSATGAIFAMEIPPSDSGFSVSLGGGAGISFANGLSWCITSGFGLTDTTAATASAIYANASYRLQ